MTKKNSGKGKGMGGMGTDFMKASKSIKGIGGDKKSGGGMGGFGMSYADF